MRCKPSHFLCGLTLIELLLCLGLLTVLLVAGLGFGSQFLAKRQALILEKQLVSVVQYSRHWAQVFHQDVTLNPLAGQNDWSKGMVLFVDNSSHHYSSQVKLIHQWYFNQNRLLRLVWHGFQADDYLMFSKETHRSTVNGHFLILSDGVVLKRLVVNRLGRIAP